MRSTEDDKLGDRIKRFNGTKNDDVYSLFLKAEAAFESRETSAPLDEDNKDRGINQRARAGVIKALDDRLLRVIHDYRSGKLAWYKLQGRYANKLTFTDLSLLHNVLSMKLIINKYTRDHISISEAQCSSLESRARLLRSSQKLRCWYSHWLACLSAVRQLHQ